MRTLLGIVAILLASASVMLLVRCARESVAGAAEEAGLAGEAGHDGAAPDPALRRIREEIRRAEQPHVKTDEDRRLDALAWIAEHRPDGWPYAELEAWMLAQWDAMGEGTVRSAAWAMQNARIEVEVVRALDADRDGVVTEDEVDAFAAFYADMQDPSDHPYLVAKYDADGDGLLSFDEMPWQSLEAMNAQRQGLIERAQLDQWDSDGDGALSEQERAAGAERALLNAKLFDDGHVEYVPKPAENAALEQEGVRAKLLEECGQEVLELTLERQAGAAEMFLSIGLGEAMRLLDGRPDYASGEPAPAQPDSRDYDPDGDGQMDETQLAEFQEAMSAWEDALRLHSAELFARYNQSVFEATLLDADFNHDTYLTPDEWDAHLENLEDARDRELFLHHYDLDKSGRVTPDEVETYLHWYRDGSLRSDVNYDGVVDVRDLELVAKRYQQQ